MADWLKLIGSSKEPVSSYDEEYVGFRKADKKPRVTAGDHLFLYAPGGSKRIFALAEAIRDPEHDPKYNPDKEGSCYWRLAVRYLISLPVASGIHISDVSSHRDLTKSLLRASHIELSSQESGSARKKLEERATQ
jgi:hypothetical protein